MILPGYDNLSSKEHLMDFIYPIICPIIFTKAALVHIWKRSNPDRLSQYRNSSPMIWMIKWYLSFSLRLFYFWLIWSMRLSNTLQNRNPLHIVQLGSQRLLIFGIPASIGLPAIISNHSQRSNLSNFSVGSLTEICK